MVSATHSQVRCVSRMLRPNDASLFALIGIFCARTLVGGEIEQLVIQVLREPGRKTDLSVINDGNREAAVKLLRDVASGRVREIGTVLPSETGAEVVLLRLNDAPTITRLLDEYKTRYGSRKSFWQAEHLEWAGQAAVIPYLAEDYFLEDGERSNFLRDGDGGVRVIPRSVFSGITTLRIAVESRQLSEETRAWAKQKLLEGYYPFDKFREDMRLWWKQNEAAFKKGEYQSVKPLQPSLQPPPPNTPPSTPFPSTPSASMAPPPVTPSLTATPAPSKSGPHTAGDRRGRPWPWLAVVTTFSVALWWFRYSQYGKQRTK